MFLRVKAATREFFNCCNDSHYNKAYIAQIGRIVGYSYHIGCFMCTNALILRFDSVDIFVWCNHRAVKFSLLQRIDHIIATNCANLMIVVSFERGELDLLIHGKIVNFSECDANVQSNQKDI